MTFFEYEADWYIVLDADEIFYGTGMNAMHRLLRRTAQKPEVMGYKVISYFDLDRFCKDSSLPWTRIVHKSAGFHYRPDHWMRFDKNNRNMDDYCPTLDNVAVLQLSELCPKWRQAAKSKWVDWRQTQKGDGW